MPVRREEIRLEQEPIDGLGTGAGRQRLESRSGGGAVGDPVPGSAVADEEHEVVLHAERPVVRTETVPVGRFRMDKQTLN